MKALLRTILQKENGGESGGFSLRVGWLIDGTGEACLRDAVVRIDNGRISAIEPFSSETFGPGPCLDATACTVVPPLIDCHVHLVFSGSRDAHIRKQQLAQTGASVQTVIAAHVNDHWKHGVVAVRDGGDRHAQVLRYKRERQHRSVQPTRVAATACAWHAQGRYGRMLGRVLSADRQGIERMVDGCRQCDHIKVIQSGMNSLDHYGMQTAPQFPESVLRSVVAAAAGAGKPVMVHANGREPVRSAAAAGCRSIEHGYFMGRDNLLRLAEAGIFWVPTAIPMAALAQSDTLPPARQAVAQRTLDHQLRQIGDAHAAGVRIALGTDAGSIGVDHGVAVRQELALFVQAGLSLEAAVSSGTQTAAELLGIEDFGVLKPGRPANLLVMPGAPGNLTDRLHRFDAAYLNRCWHTRDAVGAWAAI